MLFLADKIGSEYKNWEAGDTIFLQSPTGSGKTFFILHKLLEEAEKRRQKNLYFVNRVILEEQLKVEVDKLPMEMINAVKIVTYQAMENGKNINFSDFQYVVCDEAHYFMADALFNPGTIRSYEMICQCIGNQTCIFMSATIEAVKKRILERAANIDKFHSQVYHIPTQINIGMHSIKKNKIYKYNLDPQKYDLDFHILQNTKDAVEMICDSDKKWLIFVGSIEEGNKLKRMLLSELKKKNEEDSKHNTEVVFLSAPYWKRKEGREEVGRITKEQKQNARILISTSVMDNGITLKDSELRNIVIRTDTKEELIQMLGRKRMDGNRTDIYLVNVDGDVIRKRMNHYQRIRMAAKDYMKGFCELKDKIGKYSSMPQERNVGNDEYSRRLRAGETGVPIVESVYPSVSEMRDSILKEEFDFIGKQHCVYLDRILDPEEGNLLRYVFYANNGWLCLNQLAIDRVEELYLFYYELYEEFKRGDDNALLRRQLQWLGLSEGEADEKIEVETKELVSKYADAVKECFRKIEGKSLKVKEFNEFQKELRGPIHFFDSHGDLFEENMNTEQLEKLNRNIGKAGRPLGKKNMQLLNDIMQVHYEERAYDDDGEKIYEYHKVEE